MTLNCTVFCKATQFRSRPALQSIVHLAPTYPSSKPSCPSSLHPIHHHNNVSSYLLLTSPPPPQPLTLTMHPWALISPASRGIGLALTRRVLQTTNVPVVATARGDLEKTKEEILRGLDGVDGGRLEVLRVDVCGTWVSVWRQGRGCVWGVEERGMAEDRIHHGAPFSLFLNFPFSEV